MSSVPGGAEADDFMPCDLSENPCASGKADLFLLPAGRQWEETGHFQNTQALSFPTGNTPCPPRFKRNHRPAREKEGHA